ncbi:MAG TPA: LysM domain-containing protein [Limnochordia bacterium]|nr:LysM domain-containing protein [Limnochordia bacterium]
MDPSIKYVSEPVGFEFEIREASPTRLGGFAHMGESALWGMGRILEKGVVCMASRWWEQRGAPPFDDEWDGPPSAEGVHEEDFDTHWPNRPDRHHHHHDEHHHHCDEHDFHHGEHHHHDLRFCCPPGCSRTVYIVRPGDTLAGILQRFAVTAAMLGCCNPCVDLCCLRPGEALCIPNRICFPPMKHITTCHFPARAR